LLLSTIATFKALCAAPRAETSLAIAKARVKAEEHDLLCVIIEPTRELAQQVYDEIKKFKVNLTTPAITHELFIGGIHTLHFYPVTLLSYTWHLHIYIGGEGSDKVGRGGVNIAVGTTGRLADLIQRGRLDVSKVRAFVLDEADSLVEQGNKKVIAK
jgi:ATP-dependent RNA helicase DDX1